jgi:hypothetical protein
MHTSRRKHEAEAVAGAGVPEEGSEAGVTALLARAVRFAGGSRSAAAGARTKTRWDAEQ